MSGCGHVVPENVCAECVRGALREMLTRVGNERDFHEAECERFRKAEPGVTRLARFEAFGEALDVVAALDGSAAIFTAIRELRSAARPRSGEAPPDLRGAGTGVHQGTLRAKKRSGGPPYGDGATKAIREWMSGPGGQEWLQEMGYERRSEAAPLATLCMARGAIDGVVWDCMLVKGHDGSHHAAGREWASAEAIPQREAEQIWVNAVESFVRDHDCKCGWCDSVRERGARLYALEYGPRRESAQTSGGGAVLSGTTGAVSHCPPATTNTEPASAPEAAGTFEDGHRKGFEAGKAAQRMLDEHPAARNACAGWGGVGGLDPLTPAQRAAPSSGLDPATLEACAKIADDLGALWVPSNPGSPESVDRMEHVKHGAWLVAQAIRRAGQFTRPAGGSDGS